MQHTVAWTHKYEVSEILMHYHYALIYDNLYRKRSMISDTSVHKKLSNAVDSKEIDKLDKLKRLQYLVKRVNKK